MRKKKKKFQREKTLELTLNELFLDQLEEHSLMSAECLRRARERKATYIT